MFTFLVIVAVGGFIAYRVWKWARREFYCATYYNPFDLWDRQRSQALERGPRDFPHPWEQTGTAQRATPGHPRKPQMKDVTPKPKQLQR